MLCYTKTVIFKIKIAEQLSIASDCAHQGHFYESKKIIL